MSNANDLLLFINNEMASHYISPAEGTAYKNNTIGFVHVGSTWNTTGFGTLDPDIFEGLIIDELTNRQICFRDAGGLVASQIRVIRLDTMSEHIYGNRQNPSGSTGHGYWATAFLPLGNTLFTSTDVGKAIPIKIEVV